MNARKVSRRRMMQAGLAMAVVPVLGTASSGGATPVEGQAGAQARKGRIRQSVCRWCYGDTSLEDLCVYAAKIGLKGIDLLGPEEWEVPRRHGLVCSMGDAGGGEITRALNRLENHAAIEAALRKNIPLAAKLGVPNVITFSGNRGGLSDEEGAKNTVIGLKRLKTLAEDHGVSIQLELLNSRVDHHDYMADHTAWGVRVMQEVNSPNIKLLYDIYHMQIMEGDLIQTIQDHHEWIGHFHTGGVPGRHELNGSQEVRWDGVMRAIAATGFQGYVAHEFLPTADPFTSLREAVDLCDV